IWLVFIVSLSIFAPGSKEFSVSNVSQLYPDTSSSEIAQQKMDTYFKEDDGIPAIIVVENAEHVNKEELMDLSVSLSESDIPYVKNMIPFSKLPSQAVDTFVSEDDTAAFLPVLFEEDITSKEINVGLEEMEPIFSEFPDLERYITGPAGIAVDASD